MGFGLLSILLARILAPAAEGHKKAVRLLLHREYGMATFAFGMGGPIATFGALLHMLVHSLTKSAIFFTAGHASQMHGTQEMDKIQRAHQGEPGCRLGVYLRRHSPVGMPPFGLFASEFLILTATIKDTPLLTPFLLLGLAVTFAALFRRVQPMVAGLAPPGRRRSQQPTCRYSCICPWC